jgi:hypothetical protein
MNDMRELMEAVEELNEAYVEYRDPGGHFQIIYEPPRGYFAIARNDLPDISGESFDDLDDAIEHAEISLDIAYDDAVYDGEIGADPVEEEFSTEPDRYMPFSGGGGIEDSFNDSNPARDIYIKAVNDVPSLYMKAGDTMFIKPTENQGEVYSEENGLEYDWDWIVELLMRGDVEETDDGYPGETEPYIEEDTLDNAVVAPLENVMRHAQQKLTDAASEFADSAEFVKRRYPEHREEYNMLVDIERELDELRRSLFEIR